MIGGEVFRPRPLFVVAGVPYHELELYRKSTALATELRRAVQSWSKFDLWTVGQQMVRSADSVGANLAESSGRWGYPDKNRFAYYARGSAYELEHWIRQALEAGLSCPHDAQARASEIARMANALVSAKRSLITDH